MPIAAEGVTVLQTEMSWREDDSEEIMSFHTVAMAISTPPTGGVTEAGPSCQTSVICSSSSNFFTLSSHLTRRPFGTGFRHLHTSARLPPTTPSPLYLHRKSRDDRCVTQVREVIPFLGLNLSLFQGQRKETFSYTFPGNSEEGRHETTTSFCGGRGSRVPLQRNYSFTNDRITALVIATRLPCGFR